MKRKCDERGREQDLLSTHVKQIQVISNLFLGENNQRINLNLFYFSTYTKERRYWSIEREEIHCPDHDARVCLERLFYLTPTPLSIQPHLGPSSYLNQSHRNLAPTSLYFCHCLCFRIKHSHF